MLKKYIQNTIELNATSDGTILWQNLRALIDDDAKQVMRILCEEGSLKYVGKTINGDLIFKKQ